jgi:hypothetical protein
MSSWEGGRLYKHTEKGNVTEWYRPLGSDGREDDEGQMPMGNGSSETLSSLPRKVNNTHVSARKTKRQKFFSNESEKAHMLQSER